MAALLDRLRLDETMPSDASPPTMSFTYPPGATPLGRYTIRRGIGIGGFGEVYFAISEAGKEVALKRVQRNLEVELRGVAQCLNLKHPHLVALHDVCHDPSGQAWVVMEYIAGPNLRDVLDAFPQGLPEPEVRRWLRGIAAAVTHLHAAGLVHRDLKPGNVFDDSGIVKVGDYGLSKFISASHRGGHTESVGTFHYMAPEIGRGEYGREIDIYSLGVMLYEMLTGDVPFDGETSHEIIVKHLTARPDLSRLPDPYREAVAKALEKDPRDRPASVAEWVGLIRWGDAATDGETFSADETMPFAPETMAPPRAPRETLAPPRETLAPARGPYSAGAGIDRPAADPPETSSRTVNRRRPAAPASEAPGERPAGDQPPVAEEPLARAIRSSLADLGRWWGTLDRSPGAKAFLAIAAAVVLAINTRWLLPLLSLIGVVYVPYYIIRQMLLQADRQPSYAAAQRDSRDPRTFRRPLTRSQWRRQMRSGLRAKPALERFGELMTSWAVAAPVAALLACFAAIVGLRSEPIDAVAVAPYVWTGGVILVGCWALLGLGKLWEPDEGESIPRRLALAGVGAGVGLVAYSLRQFLLLPSDLTPNHDIDLLALPPTLYLEGVPRASAWVVHFAFLFALLRWWKPLDPLRRNRLGLWSVAVAVVAEWLLDQVIPIPQPSGMLIAGGLAIGIQMSAPWIDPKATPLPARLRWAGQASG